MIVPSADISQFIILVTYDLSGSTPQVCLKAASIGPNQALVKYKYKIIAPSGVVIHDGTFSPPDATGNAPTVCYNLPLFNQTIEWSGGLYSVIATMQDQASLEFSQTINTKICPPRGNSKTGSWYGEACLSADVNCDGAEILLSDTTNYSYQSYTPVMVSKTMTLIYPADSTGNQPSPFVANNFNDVAAPISYNGNYEARLESIYSYDMGGGVTIKILYTTYRKTTGLHKQILVECYIDLCPLICEFTELIHDTEKMCGKDAVKYEENQRLITMINGLMMTVFINKKCGKPIGKVIAEIKRISGFKCNCDCNNGIVPRTLITNNNGGSLVFSIVNAGGDVIGAWSSPGGNNYQLTLHDKAYVFDLTVGALGYGFSVAPTTTTYLKTYTLDVNILTLTSSIMDTISGDAGLKAQLCTLVSLCDPFNIFQGVDMMCVWPVLVNACDYFGELNQPINPTDTFKGIKVNGVWYYPPTALLNTDKVNINLWLQTLGFSFGASDYDVDVNGTVTLTTLANINQITRMAFVDVSTTNEYDINVVATNCGTITSTDKMQAVIGKICAIWNALYGVSSVLYKVKENSGGTPDYLINKVSSVDGSIILSVVGGKVNFKTLLRVDATDNCGGNLIDKIKSVYLTVRDQKINVYTNDYTITSSHFGATFTVKTIKIGGVTYQVNVLSTNLSGVQTALNSIGLGAFVVTSPASNIVISSLGNRYVIENVIIENSVGPVDYTELPVVTNNQLLGECAVIFIEPLQRTWVPIVIDGTLWDVGLSNVEYATMDSTRNTMMNINAVPLLGFTIGTFPLNPGVGNNLPASSRPRLEQRIPFQTGWDGVSANATNYFIIKPTGYIDVEINLPTSNEMRVDSIYFPIGTF